MKNLLLFSIFAAIASAVAAQVVDPYHIEDGGFGYMINSDQKCSVWWAEGVYKVMKDTKLPKKSNGEIKLWSAKNEYESFILVVNPKTRLDNFTIEVSGLKHNDGSLINSEEITVRKVEYVNTTKPTDNYSFAGLWPDPLPLYSGTETLNSSGNQPFWITVKVPSNSKAGNYSGNIILSSDDWDITVPLKMVVWDFSLPSKPTMRSGFGLQFNFVKKYENINTKEEEKLVFDNYMKFFSEYKISPYNPFQLTPIREEVTGVPWSGGYFDSDVKHSGVYSYRIEDNSVTSNTEGTHRNLIPVKSNISYQLTWFARALEQEQEYLVGVECYNSDKELLIFQNRFKTYKGQSEWKREELDLSNMDKSIEYIRIRLFPSVRTINGENKGTVWFDDISLLNTDTNQNEFVEGNFEVDLDDIDIKLDFTEFNKAGKRYIDEFGFTGFNIHLKGLGGGNYHSRHAGVFEGFKQGTDEYNVLMERYLFQIQDNLEKKGWLGKEYIYWYDEPSVADYPFVRETNAFIKNYAPKLTTFITEFVSGQDIQDVTDISCTIWNLLDHDKIKKMNNSGLEHWSYLCTGPKSPWITLFIDHDAVNMRAWLWGSYKFQLKGILIWSTNYWNSETATPLGYLQNPWEVPMSYTSGYGTPWGIQNEWGNGDGRLFYPNNRDPNNDTRTYTGGPIPSVRLEILRDGIEDYEYFVMLEELINAADVKNNRIINEARKLLSVPDDIIRDEKTYSKNPQKILEHRKKLAEFIVKLK